VLNFVYHLFIAKKLGTLPHNAFVSYSPHIKHRFSYEPEYKANLSLPLTCLEKRTGKFRKFNRIVKSFREAGIKLKMIRLIGILSENEHLYNML